MDGYRRTLTRDLRIPKKKKKGYVPACKQKIMRNTSKKNIPEIRGYWLFFTHENSSWPSLFLHVNNSCVKEELLYLTLCPQYLF